MKNKVVLRPDPKMVEFLKWASETVKTWPAWKRGILEASSKTHNKESR